MKLPKSQRDSIINGLLSVLLPAVEEVEEIDEVDGQVFLDQGVYKAANGTPILAGIKYAYSKTVIQSVNHREKLEHLIAEAGTMDEMKTYLAAYYNKFTVHDEPAADQKGN